MMKKCKECALKHLRAAYAYAETSEDVSPVLLDVSVRSLVSRAYVLATEAPAYPDHYGMAVGTLVMAEEEAAMIPDECAGRGTSLALRDVRLRSPDASTLAFRLRENPLCDPFVGHVLEALREGGIAGLPCSITRQWFSDNFKSLEKVVSEEKVPEEAKGDGKKEGGETTMAKSCKAACKGGKCAAPAVKKGAVKKGKKAGK